MESQPQQGSPEVQTSTTSPATDPTAQTENVRTDESDVKNSQANTDTKEVYGEKSSSQGSGGKGDGAVDLESGQPEEPRRSQPWRRYRSQIRIIFHLVVFILFTG